MSQESWPLIRRRNYECYRIDDYHEIVRALTLVDKVGVDDRGLHEALDNLEQVLRQSTCVSLEDFYDRLSVAEECVIANVQSVDVALLDRD